MEGERAELDDCERKAGGDAVLLNSSTVLGRAREEEWEGEEPWRKEEEDEDEEV